ncbi:polymer-forming cytoskeletal protein [Candidatus Uhrbacteria bacterium]|nr:polymer-forming cytoskeletal protein [Candidatus Uhrbacteria bacterium]
MFKKTQDIGAIAHTGGDTTESVIGPSVHLEGNFNSSGNIVVVGSLTGSLTTSGNVRVEEGAKVQATVSAAHIQVAGEVRGDIQARDRLELAPTARVFGNVEVKVLSVAPGAILHGKCLMKGNGKIAEKVEAKISRQPVIKVAAQSEE